MHVLLSTSNGMVACKITALCAWPSSYRLLFWVCNVHMFSMPLSKHFVMGESWRNISPEHTGLCLWEASVLATFEKRNHNFLLVWMFKQALISTCLTCCFCQLTGSIIKETQGELVLIVNSSAGFDLSWGRCAVWEYCSALSSFESKMSEQSSGIGVVSVLGLCQFYCSDKDRCLLQEPYCSSFKIWPSFSMLLHCIYLPRSPIRKASMTRRRIETNCSNTARNVLLRGTCVYV